MLHIAYNARKITLTGLVHLINNVQGPTYPTLLIFKSFQSKGMKNS